VPPLLRLLAEGNPGQPGRRIGYLSAGMPMDLRTAELVGTVLGGWLGEVYGTTETGPICVRPPGPWPQALSLGQPLPGVRIELSPLEAELQEAELQARADETAGSAGLVTIHSSTAMTGYLFPDRVDPAAIANGFVTGDIGRMTPDGLVIVGRLANCINVGGTKVSPEEVEAVLLEFPAVRSCLVDGEADEWLGQKIRATVTPADVDLTALQAFCRERLSKTKQPSRFVSLDTLATTATGKVIRRPASDRQLSASGGPQP
jgi:acyl-CoA synthetase (AMP-forming)/AMP-acid ligase II